MNKLMEAMGFAKQARSQRSNGSQPWVVIIVEIGMNHQIPQAVIQESQQLSGMEHVERKSLQGWLEEKKRLF